MIANPEILRPKAYAQKRAPKGWKPDGIIGPESRAAKTLNILPKAIVVIWTIILFPNRV